MKTRGRRRADDISVTGRLLFSRGGSHFLGSGRIELLQGIARTGSIASAAKEMGMSYKAAWDAVDAMNNLAGELLLERTSGGKGGGGSRLTARGVELVAFYRQIEQRHREFVTDLAVRIPDTDRLYALVRRIGMRTSARNQFFGKVRAIRKGAVNSEVVIALPGNDAITAVITNESCRELGLAVNSDVYALVKASWVIIAADDDGARLSVRNRLSGAVSAVRKGAVNSEVTLVLAGGATVTAVVTNESVREMGLKKGSTAAAVFKASSVIVAVP